MKALTSRKILNSKSGLQKEYIRELCFQTPFLVINTPCGIGKYKFNKIGYDNLAERNFHNLKSRLHEKYIHYD